MGTTYLLGEEVKVLSHNENYMRAPIPIALSHALGVQPGDQLRITEVDREEKSFKTEVVADDE